MKESYYFQHDYNAINDPKMMLLLSSCGLSGVGMYWIIIEILHQQEDSRITIEAYKEYIKFYCQVENRGTSLIDKIEQVLNTCGLLKEKDGFIYSTRVLKNKEKREEISEKRSLAGKLSAEIRAKNKETSTSVQQNPTSVEQGKEKKGKEIKEKEKTISTNAEQMLNGENNELEQKNQFKQKARAVETKGNYIIKLRNEKTGRNDMMEQATFNSLLNLIYNLDTDDFKMRVDKFIFIKKFIINSGVDKYLKSKIQRYDITMFLKNINLFATDDKGIIASICEKEYISKVGGMYRSYTTPTIVDTKTVPIPTNKPMSQEEKSKAVKNFRENFGKK